MRMYCSFHIRPVHPRLAVPVLVSHINSPPGTMFRQRRILYEFPFPTYLSTTNIRRQDARLRVPQVLPESPARGTHYSGVGSRVTKRSRTTDGRARSFV